MARPESKSAPQPRRRVLRIIGLAFLVLLLLGLNGWATLAILFADLSGAPPRAARAIFFALAALGMLAFVRPWRRRVIVSLVLFVCVLAWYFSIRPSNQRDWLPDVAVAPRADIHGDQVTIHGVRNFAYRSETDFSAVYDERTFDLSKLRSVDFIVSYWGPKAIAHTMLSFGFDPDEYLAISIETRKQRGEEYSALQGFFRQYELIYIIADERDLIRLRTNYRGETVHLYRLPTPMSKARAVLLDYLAAANRLADHPQFYNALTTNGTTGVFNHLSVVPPYPRFSLSVLLNGYLPRQAYEDGIIGKGMTFDEMQAHTGIYDRAKAADRDPAFSRKIREPAPTTAPMR